MDKFKPYDKVLVLGMDGLDPRRVSAMIDRGEMPNFARLRDTGSLCALATSNPAESPVAWSSLAAGCGPGQHGIFDFIHRQASNYAPFLSTQREKSGRLRATNPERFVSPRRKPGFWHYTSQQNIPTTVIRWPVTFPAETVKGRFLSGLGVPDISGRLGKHTFYTTGDVEPGDEKAMPVRWRGDVIHTSLGGPPWGGVKGAKPMRVKFQIRREEDAVTLVFGSTEQSLQCGTWSDWFRVSFQIGPVRVGEGIVKFHLVSIEPELKLFATPVQIDPSKQLWPLTTPASYGEQLVDQIGLFYTLGLPEDTHAVTEGRYDLDAFLQQVDEISTQRRAMFDYELNQFKEGLLAFVFDAGDRIQHMFWSIDDSQSPSYQADVAKKYRYVINELYREMDAILGDALQVSDEKTAIFVVSDHGFGPFRRVVHLNRWLIDHGHMVLKRGSEGRQLFADVDWSQTKAYALGFSSIYINLAGRESGGVVTPQEAEELKTKIALHLDAVRDPDTNESMVRSVYRASEIYHGPCTVDGPDLVVGFEPGYRASWQTALGGAPTGSIVSDNDSLWSADHLVDPSAVPGILASNIVLKTDEPLGTDLAPTILSCFDLPIPSHMTGHSWLVNAGEQKSIDDHDSVDSDVCDPGPTTVEDSVDGLSDADRKQLEDHLSDLGYL